MIETSSSANERIRLAVITDSISRMAGGLYWSVRALSMQATFDGIEVAVFGSKDRYSEEDAPAWSGMKVYLSDTLGPRSFGFQRGLVSRVKSFKPHIIHQHGLWMYPSLANLRLKSQGVPYIISPHGMLDEWALGNSRYKKRIARLLYEDRNLAGATCLRALCTSEMQSIRDLGITLPIAVVPNGVELPTGPLLKRPQSFVTIPDTSKIAFFLSRIHPKKGLAELLTAWSALKNERMPGPAWVLVIAGWEQNGHEAELKALSAELGIDDTIRFIGPTFGEEKTACLQHSNAFILPSFSEGLPMAVLEAWSHGLPVVMTPECNLPEGFEAQAAIEVAPSSESIAGGLRELMGMSDVNRVEMGGRGRTLINEKFQWEKIGRNMTEVYLWMLNRAPPPPNIALAPCGGAVRQ